MADVHGQAVGDGLTHVQRLEQRQFVAVREDQFGEALQHAFAFARRLPRPDTAVECPAGGGNGEFDVRLVGRLNARDPRPSIGVMSSNVSPLAALRSGHR